MRIRVRESLLALWMWGRHFLDRRTHPRGELGGSAIRRILAISCTALGDTLLSTPALRALRQTYPHARITLVVHPALLPLFLGLDEVDEWVTYDGKWRGFLQTALRLHGFDLAVVLHGNEPQATPLASLSGARYVFKLPNNNRWRFLLTNRNPVLDWESLGHGIEQRLAVARLAGAREPFQRRMFIPMHPEGEAAVREAWAKQGWSGRRVVALQPGASTQSRRWASRNFVELAISLVRFNPDIRFLVTGSPAEVGLCREIALQIAKGVPVPDGERSWASAGSVPLVALPALLQHCRVLVTGDTGPMHLAVTVETPVVALFAVSDPNRSGPAYDLDRHVIIRKGRTCDPCLSKRCPYLEPLCMNQISVEEVAAAVETVLQRADG